MATTLGQTTQALAGWLQPTGQLYCAMQGNGSGGGGGENLTNNVSTDMRDNVSISEKRKNHILYGDETGGGHLWPGKPGKSIFPRNWDVDKIMHHITDIAEDKSLLKTWTRGRHGSLFTRSGSPSRYYVEDIRNGIKIRVVIEPAGEGKNVKNENMEKILISLANEIKGLPKTDKQNVIEFAQNNEWGIALDSLASQIYEYDISITKEVYQKIKQLGEQMKMDESIWLNLKSLVK